ncbi:MAG: HAMP domain-containing histidine kinase [Acidimicrobiia bacterium]|nr:HAMP domain-containing histidine kinase [Acidimicrobiia bacterium]
MNDLGTSSRSDRRRLRAGPPVGKAFVSFVVALTVVSGLAIVERRSPIAVPPSAAAQLGVVAATLFAVSGVLSAYRAAVARSRIAGLIAGVLLGPGAAWSWVAFVDRSSAGATASALVVVASAALAILLLGRGLSSARWLEVFAGLGSLALAMAASLVRTGAATASTTGSVALLAAGAGMTCLYGLLVDIEVSEHRSIEQLRAVRRRMTDELTRNEDLLHDLRSGLLSIEAAVGAASSELAGPVQSEVARLRRLTVAGAGLASGTFYPAALTNGQAVTEWPRRAAFDLVPAVRSMIDIRRSAGLAIELRSPAAVLIRGNESELLSVVDNLIANAFRHGLVPIVVEIAETGHAVTLSVTDAGGELSAADAARVFERGVSGHPGGTGFGLSRARQLAERNSAQVVLEPTKDGTRFVVRMGSARSVGAA